MRHLTQERDRVHIVPIFHDAPRVVKAVGPDHVRVVRAVFVAGDQVSVHLRLRHALSVAPASPRTIPRSGDTRRPSVSPDILALLITGAIFCIMLYAVAAHRYFTKWYGKVRHERIAERAESE